MIHVIATIETAEGQRDGFLQVFRELVPTVRAEAGCLQYGPAIDLETDDIAAPPRPNVVVVLEQ